MVQTFHVDLTSKKFINQDLLPNSVLVLGKSGVSSACSYINIIQHLNTKPHASSARSLDYYSFSSNDP